MVGLVCTCSGGAGPGSGGAGLSAKLNSLKLSGKLQLDPCLKGGYGEIGRRYGLDWIEPWYGNLLSGNFQIQRNPGIKNGQS